MWAIVLSYILFFYYPLHLYWYVGLERQGVESVCTLKSILVIYGIDTLAIIHLKVGWDENFKDFPFFSSFYVAVFFLCWFCLFYVADCCVRVRKAIILSGLYWIWYHTSKDNNEDESRPTSIGLKLQLKKNGYLLFSKDERIFKIIRSLVLNWGRIY